jgi:hypothetical protein
MSDARSLESEVVRDSKLRQKYPPVLQVVCGRGVRSRKAPAGPPLPPPPPIVTRPDRYRVVLSNQFFDLTSFLLGCYED